MRRKSQKVESRSNNQTKWTGLHPKRMTDRTLAATVATNVSLIEGRAEGRGIAAEIRLDRSGSIETCPHSAQRDCLLLLLLFLHNNIQDKGDASSLDNTTPPIISFTRLVLILRPTRTFTRHPAIPIPPFPVLFHLWPRPHQPHTSRAASLCLCRVTSHVQKRNGPSRFHGRQNSHRRQRHQNKSTAPLLHRRSQTIPSLQTRHCRFTRDQKIPTQYRFVDFEVAFC